MVRHYTIKRHEGVLYKINYEEELDEQQYQIVTAEDGPTLVIAGAGSGKTRTVTYRVARLIESGVAVDRIMLVTFTNKAAREMLQRVDQLVKTDARKIWGGTFHSIANRVLRRDAEVLGYSQRFTILDTEDAKDILDLAIEDAKVDRKAKKFPQPSLLQDLFTLSINKEIPLEQLIEQEYSSLVPVLEGVQLVFENYRKRKKASNVMDYDDLLVNWKKLLLNHPTVKQTWCQHFKHVLVDEYQDTNKLQSDIVDLLASEHRNVMVVGDDAQSIYAFRGANFANIMGFSERYADAKVMHLSNNYRSRPEIVAVANASIAMNSRQFPKNLQAVRKASGEKPGLIPLASADEQAAFVASRILELNANGQALRDMAILYRSHWHSLEMQMELTRRNIPFSLRSGLRFFEQAHIKDVISHLRIIINPKDEMGWKRVLRLIPGIGKNTATKIWERISASEDPLSSIAKPDFALKTKAPDAWRAFVTLMTNLSSPTLVSKPGSQIELVLASGYHDYLLNAFPNANARVDDLEQLARYATRFEDTEQFLAELALIAMEKFGGAEGVSGEDVIDASEEDDDRIVLTSIHQAKGLEWKYVFLIWAADGKLPSARSLKKEEDTEEERRLFYVAITRAKDELNVCYPLMESDFTRLTVVQRPSRFISELPDDLLETWSVD